MTKQLDVMIFDVDGVFTSGHFIYSAAGKEFKAFGPDDNDAVSLLSTHLDVRCVTGDRKGFKISEKRIVDHMGLPLDLVSTTQRVDWIAERYDVQKVIYMGDGIFDHYVMRRVGYSIAPSNADPLAKQHADFVTSRAGGDRAVAEACIHVMGKFFKRYNPDIELDPAINFSGEWSG